MSGGRISLSSGHVYQDASIELVNASGYSYFTLEGVGDASVLSTLAAAPLGDHFIKSAAETNRHMFLTFKNFRIAGDGETGTTIQTAGDGIRTYGASYSRYVDLTIRYCKSNGIYLNSNGTYTCVDQLINRCTVNYCGADGVYAASNSTDVTVSNSSIYYNTDDGIEMAGGGAVLVANRIYNNTDDGVVLNGYWNVINGNYFGLHDKAITMGSGTRYTVVIGNVIKDQTTNAIYIVSGASTNMIVGNWFGTTTPAIISDAGTGTVIRNNVGWVTEAKGTSKIDSGATTVNVTHGLSATPTVINVTFAEAGSNDYGRWWISSAGATTFTVNVSSDPGASNLDFWWEAKVR